MNRPLFIKSGDKIGVTAPSKGVTDSIDINRFLNAKKNLLKKGYEVIFTDNVFSDIGFSRSSDKLIRKDEFMELIKNSEVKYIVFAKGGDFMMEILPYIDYDIIKDNPKWIQGYSDGTNLLFSITTKTFMPTVYTNNFGDYGMEILHRSVSENLEILEGIRKTQKSFEKYEDFFSVKSTGLEGLSEDKDVVYTSYNNGEKEDVSVSGILLGGCLDVISDLAGTPYEEVINFTNHYKNEGILWFFESFSSSYERIVHELWKLKEMGWFNNANGFIFGRPLFYNEDNEKTYEEAVLEVLGSENKIIFGADIGHKAPQFTMINGVYASIKTIGDKAELEYL